MVVIAMLANSTVIGLSQNRPAQQEPAPQQGQEPYLPDVIINESIIDGSTNPEQIPDQVASRLFLRFLSGRHTETEKNRARAYLRRVFGACRECSSEQQIRRAQTPYTAQIDALLTAADEYAQRVKVFEDEAKRIRDNIGDSADLTMLRSDLSVLQAQREMVGMDIMASLPNRLGTVLADGLQQYIREAFKSKIKINRPSTSQPAGRTAFAFLRAAYRPPQGSLTSGTVTYSDSWYADNSGVVYDPTDDTYDFPEQFGASEVVDAGVTEADLDGEVINVQTTLTAPGGRTATVTRYTNPSYTRAEVALLAPQPTSADGPQPEEQWRVSTRHDYRVREGGVVGLSYTPASTLPIWRIYRVFSYFNVFISIFALSMADPVQVNRWYYGRFMTVCQYRRRTCESPGCRYTAVRTPLNWDGRRACAPYLQVIGVRERSFFTFCWAAYLLPVPNPGVCY